MGKIGKTFALFLTFIVAMPCLTLLVAKPANGQTIPKPAVPEFTLTLADHSYDVPLTYTYSTDPYTGKQVQTPHGGYHVDNKTIDATIRNQPFTPYISNNSNEVNVYYNIRVKGHFADDWEWKELYSPYADRTREGVYFCYYVSPVQSSSQSTVISIPADYPTDAKIDVQVQALEGYFTVYYPYLVPAHGYYFNGAISDWSSTQIVDMPDGLISTSTPNPTSSVISSPTLASPTLEPSTPTLAPSTNGDQSQQMPTVPLTTFLLVVSVTVVIITLLLLMLFRSHRKAGTREDR